MKYLILLFYLVSCSQFTKWVEDDYFEVQGDEVNLLFSSNINGETKPCGCRQFPLGGMAQIKAMFSEISQDQLPQFYIDTGDTLFDATNIPKTQIEAKLYLADTIAMAMKKLDLKLWTPGDQDFALGTKELVKIIKKHELPVLLSNYNGEEIPHLSHYQLKIKNQTLYFIGVLDPNVFVTNKPKGLVSVEDGITRTINEIEAENKGPKTFILLSHSGIDKDKELARKFPKLHTILGSHTQSFTQNKLEENKTEIMQVMSRNHYLGVLKLAVDAKNQTKSQWKTVAIHRNLIDKLDEKTRDEWVAWLNGRDEKLNSLFLETLKTTQVDEETEKDPTAVSCKECHQVQTDFWKGTSHSLAWKTLHQAKAQNNPECIKCHSLGHGQNFTGPQNVVEFEDNKHRDVYLKELSSLYAEDSSSVREMGIQKRLAFNQKVTKLGEKHKLIADFSNVQCLHCHQKTSDHPFDQSTPPPGAQERKNTCLSCHNPDHSDTWYSWQDPKNPKLNEAQFQESLKKVSCPKG